MFPFTAYGNQLNQTTRLISVVGSGTNCTDKILRINISKYGTHLRGNCNRGYHNKIKFTYIDVGRLCLPPVQSFLLQAKRGCARSRLLLKKCVVAKRMVCTTINLVGTLHVLRYGMYIIKGGECSVRATD